MLPLQSQVATLQIQVSSLLPLISAKLEALNKAQAGTARATAAVSGARDTLSVKQAAAEAAKKAQAVAQAQLDAADAAYVEATQAALNQQTALNEDQESLKALQDDFDKRSREADAAQAAAQAANAELTRLQSEAAAQQLASQLGAKGTSTSSMLKDLNATAAKLETATAAATVKARAGVNKLLVAAGSLAGNAEALAVATLAADTAFKAYELKQVAAVNAGRKYQEANNTVAAKEAALVDAKQRLVVGQNTLNKTLAQVAADQATLAAAGKVADTSTLDQLKAKVNSLSVAAATAAAKEKAAADAVDKATAELSALQAQTIGASGSSTGINKAVAAQTALVAAQKQLAAAEATYNNAKAAVMTLSSQLTAATAAVTAKDSSPGMISAAADAAKAKARGLLDEVTQKLVGAAAIAEKFAGLSVGNVTAISSSNGAFGVGNGGDEVEQAAASLAAAVAALDAQGKVFNETVAAVAVKQEELASAQRTLQTKQAELAAVNKQIAKVQAEVAAAQDKLNAAVKAAGGATGSISRGSSSGINIDPARLAAAAASAMAAKKLADQQTKAVTATQNMLSAAGALSAASAKLQDAQKVSGNAAGAALTAQKAYETAQQQLELAKSALDTSLQRLAAAKATESSLTAPAASVSTSSSKVKQ